MNREHSDKNDGQDVARHRVRDNGCYLDCSIDPAALYRGDQAEDGCQNGGTSCYLRDPQVTVEMTKGRPYYILGEVTRAGEYPFTSGLTVLNAIAAAGDFTYRADKKKVLITSADGVEREVVVTSTTPVNPGDRIRIKERFF